jgi:hypothetical protein
MFSHALEEGKQRATVCGTSANIKHDGDVTNFISRQSRCCCCWVTCIESVVRCPTFPSDIGSKIFNHFTEFGALLLSMSEIEQRRHHTRTDEDFNISKEVAVFRPLNPIDWQHNMVLRLIFWINSASKRTSISLLILWGLRKVAAAV